MSALASHWAYRQFKVAIWLSAVDKSVLASIAYHTQPRSWYADVGLDEIARDTGFADRAIRQTIRWMDGAFLIRHTGRYDDGYRLPNRYILQVHLDLTGPPFCWKPNDVKIPVHLARCGHCNSVGDARAPDWSKHVGDQSPIGA